MGCLWVGSRHPPPPCSTDTLSVHTERELARGVSELSALVSPDTTIWSWAGFSIADILLLVTICLISKILKKHCATV